MIVHPFGDFGSSSANCRPTAPCPAAGARSPSRSGSTAPSSRAAWARWPRRCRWTCAPTTPPGCKLKLDALATVAEERAFEMPFPPHGERRLFPGVVAATAAVIRWRCEQLGALRAPAGRRRCSTRCSAARSRAPARRARWPGRSTSTTRPAGEALDPDAEGDHAARPRRQRRDAPVRARLLGQLPARARRPGAPALARHAGDRPGLDRHEAAQAAQLRRAAGPLHGLRAGPAQRRSAASSSGPRPWPTWRGC